MAHLQLCWALCAVCRVLRVASPGHSPTAGANCPILLHVSAFELVPTPLAGDDDDDDNCCRCRCRGWPHPSDPSTHWGHRLQRALIRNAIREHSESQCQMLLPKMHWTLVLIFTFPYELLYVLEFEQMWLISRICLGKLLSFSGLNSLRFTMNETLPFVRVTLKLNTNRFCPHIKFLYRFQLLRV